MNKEECEKASEIISEYMFTSNEYTPSVDMALEALTLIDKLIAEHFEKPPLKEKAGLLDYKLNEICVGDEVSIFGFKGIVDKVCGAYGILFDDFIEWSVFEENILKITDCDNLPRFCYNDNFISFWEIYWNYNCEENYLPMVERLDELEKKVQENE